MEIKNIQNNKIKYYIRKIKKYKKRINIVKRK